MAKGSRLRCERNRLPRGADGRRGLASHVDLIAPLFEFAKVVRLDSSSHCFCSVVEVRCVDLLACKDTESITVDSTCAASMFSFIAARAAFWHIETTSAPEQPALYVRVRPLMGVWTALTRAASSSTASVGSTLILPRHILKMLARASRSGAPTNSNRSRRPGRSRAESWPWSACILLPESGAHDRPRAICSGQYDDALQAFNTVHLGEQGCQDAA
jgi:hypothetical protein